MRTYQSKEVHKNAKHFDPVRAKLRIMPQERVGLFVIGKDPDFFFVKAAKQSLNNEYTHAIESLDKGLKINPFHLPCRFNHGVLMFKLGLLNKARFDFMVVSCKYPKEWMGHFNYGLVLFQLGYYNEAMEPLELIIKQSHGALSQFQQQLKEKKEKL